MTNKYVLVRVCICVLGFHKPEALGALMSFLEFLSLCVFNVFIELHAMDEKDSTTSPLESETEFYLYERST